MKIKVFTLAFDPERGAFDDREVEAFLRERAALAVYHHLVDVDGQPRIVLIVPYRDHGRAAPSPPRDAAGRVEVPEADRPLFEALRHWRNERARKDGRPAYVMFNNQQLADIAAARPTSREALGALPGIGEARIPGSTPRSS